MRTLIDNTGLHSATKPFLKREFSEVDLYGLLQLCITIIFSNEILIDNRKEKMGVSNFTDLAIEKLVSFGFEKELFDYTNFSEEKYDILYKQGADELSHEINYLFTPTNSTLDGMFPEGVAKNYLNIGSEFSRIANKKSQDLFEEIIGDWKSEKTVELTDYLVAISPQLQESLIYFGKNNPKITNAQLYQLNIFMRYRLNEIFASDKNASHTPSIARAKLVRGGEQFLISMVEGKLDRLISEIKGVGMLMPSIMDYLLTNSKGNINRLIDLTLKLREKAKPLRSLIDKKLKKYNLNETEGKFQLDKKLDEFIDIVKYDLGIDTPKLKDVFEFTLSSLVLFDVKQHKLIEWLKYRRNRKKVSVLTEVSKFAIYNQSLNKNSELLKIFRK